MAFSEREGKRFENLDIIGPGARVPLVDPREGQVSGEKLRHNLMCGGRSYHEQMSRTERMCGRRGLWEY